MRAIDAIIEEIRKDGEQNRNEIGRMMKLIEQLGDGLSFDEQMQAEVEELVSDEPEQLNGVFRTVNGKTKLVNFYALRRIVNAYSGYGGDITKACAYLDAHTDINTSPPRLSTFISVGRKAGYVEGYDSVAKVTEKYWNEFESNYD